MPMSAMRNRWSLILLRNPFVVVFLPPLRGRGVSNIIKGATMIQFFCLCLFAIVAYWLMPNQD